jgi:DNA-directed RNA polymerase subunit RPC12/RpoP
MEEMQQVSFLLNMIYKQYHCQWCGNEFEGYAEYSKGTADPTLGTSKGKKGSLSSQVKCPHCLNFIPTWDIQIINGKKIKKRQ